MPALARGTFATGAVAASGNIGEVVDVPSSTTTMRLSIVGLDGSNTVKTQKITVPGGTWADQVTYNSDQSLTAITVVPGEQWRLVGVTQQATKDIRYKMSCES